MADERLRSLERAAAAGDPDAAQALERHSKRAGIRLVVRHYIQEEHHGAVGSSGKIELNASGPGWPIRADRIYSKCGVELWPRTGGFYRKKCHYTEHPEEVTCKTCLRSMSKPEKRVRYRTHYAPGSRGRRSNNPVCGRDDSDKFEQTISWSMRGVNCPTCKLIMQKGRRRSRRPK